MRCQHAIDIAPQKKKTPLHPFTVMADKVHRLQFCSVRTFHVNEFYPQKASMKFGGITSYFW